MQSIRHGFSRCALDHCLFAFCVVDPVEKVAIPVALLNDTAVLVTDTLHHAGRRGDVEAARFANGHAPHVRSGFFAFGHDGFNQIARLKAVHGFFAHQVAPWKAEGVQARALVTAPAHGFDGQGMFLGPLPVRDGIHLAHANRIQCMCFWHAKCGAIEFGAATRSQLQSQTGGFQCVGQRPAGRIHGGGVA